MKPDVKRHQVRRGSAPSRPSVTCTGKDATIESSATNGAGILIRGRSPVPHLSSASSARSSRAGREPGARSRAVDYAAALWSHTGGEITVESHARVSVRSSRRAFRGRYTRLHDERTRIRNPPPQVHERHSGPRPRPQRGLLRRRRLHRRRGPGGRERRSSPARFASTARRTVSESSTSPFSPSRTRASCSTCRTCPSSTLRRSPSTSPT